jgi:hypothetical protein
MALNFPNSPIDGEIFNGFVWNESMGVWEKQNNIKFFIGPTPPNLPLPGDVWFNSVIGIPALYYDDGSSQQWVEIGGSTIQI